ncbi:hypothetical protein PG994_011613 [Apiospora phragmitis]|uniref:Rhodopsin domain-containing protein n=1 Tax=Apiospora phragmitis TaxID=2905665 RepID=A0ABR1TTI9_9PEZI
MAVVDWTGAILPFFMLRNLQMPKRKKLSIQLILGLGIFGSLAGLLRLPLYRYYDVKQYPEHTLCKYCLCTRNDVSIYHDADKSILSLDYYGLMILFSQLEGGLGIIACSLPPLRALWHRYSYQSAKSMPGSKHAQRGNTGDFMMGKKSEWDRLADESSDLESQRDGIVKKTEVTISTAKASQTGSSTGRKQ